MTCKISTPYVSGGYTTNCIGDGVYQRSDGLVTFDSNSAKLAWQRQQPPAAVATAKSWAPWAIGGLVVAVGAWLLTRD
jgi:hypothetical protein